MQNNYANVIREKLINYISELYNKKKYEKCLKCIMLYAEFLYTINQIYTDEKLEGMLKKIFRNILLEREVYIKEKKDGEFIVFYDSFGYDLRGIAYIYIHALTQIGYNVIYITNEEKKDKIPHIKKELKRNLKNKIIYFQDRKIINEYQNIVNILENYKITTVFLYMAPEDIRAVFLGYYFEQKSIRYLINLTDHAFWLGKNAADFFIEYRDYGASISKYYRKIEKEKIIKLPYYPVIDKNIEFLGFPEDANGYKIIFSGGSLYKTAGDNGKYYKIVEDILREYNDVAFIYAGSGDTSELENLKRKFDKRVFYFSERKDLYQIMKHSTIYLSTYPISGGLMIQYAVAAGTVPFTLIYDDSSGGVLLNPDKFRIEFNNEKEMLSEIKKCLEDEAYLEKKKERLHNQILSEETFNKEIKNLIENKTTHFKINYKVYDTIKFRQEYLRIFDKKKWMEIVGRKKYIVLLFGIGRDILEAICSKMLIKFRTKL